MISYTERRIFTPQELELLRRATELVAACPTQIDGEEVRCHELARAVGRILELPHQDGHYGFVDHTWLWTRPLPALPLAGRIGWPSILDVYAVGQLPMVRLVDCSHASLPHVGWSYRPGDPRSDVRLDVVEELVRQMRRARSWKGAGDGTAF